MTMDYGTILELRDLHSALKRHNGGYFFPKVVVKYSNLCNHLSSEGHLQVCMCVWVRVSVVKYSNLCDYLSSKVNFQVCMFVCMHVRKSECGEVFKFIWLFMFKGQFPGVWERAWTDLCHIFLTSTGL